MQLAFHVFLFIPLCFVLNFWIKWLSLTFLIIGSSDLTFSSTAIFISDILCPGRLKCSPVALSSFSFLTYPLCSLLLRARVLSVSPIYCFRHFSHQITSSFEMWSVTIKARKQPHHELPKSELVLIDFRKRLSQGGKPKNSKVSDHDSNPSQTMALTACPVGRVCLTPNLT